MALMEDAARAHSRVLDDPVPSVRLMAFGDSGIELELRIWIQDPEAGLANVRSDLNLAIWRAFKPAGIVIPYPQRDLHIRTGLETLKPWRRLRREGCRFDFVAGVKREKT